MEDGSVVTSVLVVAEVRLYREGLAAGLASRQQLRVAGTSASSADALLRIRELLPDVVLVDMAIRESLDLVRNIRAAGLPSKVLAFAIDEANSDVLACAEAGAAGYVSADASIDELATAIERVPREELMCSPRIAAQLFYRISERAPVAGAADPLFRPLTGRERQVLECIRLGHSNKEIAQRLNIAEPTVKNHVHNVLEKLEVSTRAQAAARLAVPRFASGLHSVRTD